MQCSLSPPKSSSNWLDRLHASKGFSISADLDLDRFLTSSSSSDPDPNPIPNPNPNPNPNPPSPRNATLPDPPTKRRRRRRRRRPAPAANPPLFDLMSSALAELFVMGGPPPSQAIGTPGERRKKRKKRSARKQANPKACPPSASASAAAGGGGAACGAAPSSADNSVAEEATKGSKKKRAAAAEGPSKDSDLAGYRRTDVTVIDTSSPGWKSVKLIYRKGKEWKVRVKKHWNACQKKKRKVGLVRDKGKEQSKLGSKVPDLKEFFASLDQLRDQENVRAKDGDTLKVSDDRTRIPVKRPKFSRSPRLSAVKKSSLSLLRMQVVPVEKNSAPSSNKGPHKG